MAKNTSASTSTPTPTSQPANPSSTSQPLSEKEQLRKLFEQYNIKQQELDHAKTLTNKATEERSEILQAMIDLRGAGPYTVDGQYYGKIVKRGSTLFFRGKGEKETVEL